MGLPGKTPSAPSVCVLETIIAHIIKNTCTQAKKTSYHHTSFPYSFLFLFTSFSSPLANFLTLILHFTCSRHMTRQMKHNNIGTRWPNRYMCSLQFNWSRLQLLIQAHHDGTPIIQLKDKLLHHPWKTTLRRHLPGSQGLFFLPELEPHLSQLPWSRTVWLMDDDHGGDPDRDDKTI